MISIHNISNKTGCAGIPVVAAFQYTPNIIETLKYNGLISISLFLNSVPPLPQQAKE
jgi:hypothetical protein